MVALETHRMREVVNGLETISDKIRALDAAGFARADIARFLDKRYQHVRNVLVSDRPAKRTQQPRPDAPSASYPGAARLKDRLQIGAGGRIVIPAEMRAAMGVAEGDTLIARVVDGELSLLSPDAAIRKVQHLVRQHVPEGVSLVDELIQDRRAEAQRESGS
ncbi:MAG: AbrB/MazE/SpoVT family DNA-binding domain-containing protein [Alphaproteobacteria bacterium]|nr:AbrB/MazE/SpoVT family DNA-binding domain-containing protein [Alphaproteobacteria bacterium]MBU0803105.1 AbrB/MazE/SpoVT family DNA-binding domain-containing protein [Alphaproteobacteria bacterium]MBU0873793.1 AbrB/MazE/SpoVT family DNA-binding domain-containing protein [Alphaproteobacteria bacterium]MBU1400707.1 AbrB/MazE/SpoVT family DNA-binding domain-containing protein [Alphaproteobacteria bacterium]MBU1590580.1 AbrB/MazE/SpoVT family DNA-binding domain-containing protein [Alphaproteobac